MGRYKGVKGLAKALDNFENVVTGRKQVEEQNTLLTSEFIRYNDPYVTYQSKELAKSIPRNSEYEKGIVKAVAPYAGYIYYGKSKSGKPLKYSKAKAKPRFFEYTWKEHADDIKEAFIKYENKELNKL